MDLKKSFDDRTILIVGGVIQEEEVIQASSLGEFVRALFLGLGALLIVSGGTFLLFYVIVAALLGLVT